jgi:hypothetical protein
MKSRNELLRVTATQGEVESDETGDVTIVPVTYGKSCSYWALSESFSLHLDNNDKSDHDCMLT